MMMGLGANIDAHGNITIPSWCSWMPFASFADACKPPTPEQIRQADMSNIGPAASADSVAALQQQWAQTEEQQCQLYPDECAAYQFAITHPTTSAAFGTGAFGQAIGSVASGLASSPLVWIAIAGIAIVLMKRR